MFFYFLFYGVSRMKKELFSRRFIILVLCLVLVAAGLFGVFFTLSPMSLLYSRRRLTARAPAFPSLSITRAPAVTRPCAFHWCPTLPPVPAAVSSSRSRPFSWMRKTPGTDPVQMPPCFRFPPGISSSTFPPPKAPPMLFPFTLSQKAG